MPELRDPSDRWLAAALFAAGFALLFRGWLFSGFDGAFGDDEDGYLALALIEHWHHVFLGATDWMDLFAFYPQHGTLGYTDAFFLFGAAYAPLRILGADAFTAYMLVMVALAVAGFFGFRRLAMHHFGIPPAYAAVGAFLFAFANMDAVKLIHVQAYSAMLLPGLCDLLLSAWQRERHGAIFAAAGGFLYAALFLTGFQTAWFFGFFVMLLLLLHPAIYGLAATQTLVFDILTTKRGVVLAAASGFAIGIVPFLALYLPVFMAGHSRDFAEVAANMPDWRDLANITAENAVWGNVLQRLGIADRPDRPVWEVELAFTPIVLAVFIVGLAVLTARMDRKSGRGDRVFVMLGVAVVILWLLQMDYFGVRPWRIVWAAIPGAKAIRYTYRSQLVVNLPAVLVVAHILANMAIGRFWSFILCAAVIVGQINPVWPPIMSRRAVLAWIEAVPPPPASCHIFFVAPNAGPADRSGPQHQDDAMLFAELRGIPTVNGYSSWFPDGWALDEPASPGYGAAVRQWAQRNGIAASLCGLEPRSGRWTVGLPE